MQKLFLASLFKDVSHLFVDFANEMGLIVDELEISTASYLDIENKLENNDYIYVVGGNTFFLLQEMNKSGAGNLIKMQINAGKLFIGESAGAILLAPDIEYSKDTDNPLAAPQLKTYEALDIIDFYPVPHDKDDSLKEAVEILISKYGTQLPLVPFSNSQAILVMGKKWQIVPQDSKTVSLSGSGGDSGLDRKC